MKTHSRKQMAQPQRHPIPDEAIPSQKKQIVHASIPGGTQDIIHKQEVRNQQYVHEKIQTIRTGKG